MPTRVDRAVVDTNVLISAALGNGSTPRRALDALRVNGAVLLFADETFHGLHSRLQRPKFDPYVSHERRATFLQQIVPVAEWVSITGATLGCRDPDDDKLLETAMLGEAECLITGDQDLLEMRVFRGIPILDAATFLRRHPGLTGNA